MDEKSGKTLIKLRTGQGRELYLCHSLNIDYADNYVHVPLFLYVDKTHVRSSFGQAAILKQVFYRVAPLARRYRAKSTGHKKMQNSVANQSAFFLFFFFSFFFISV